MGFPWYLKPDLLLHADMLDKQEELEIAASSSKAADQRQDQEIQLLKKRVTELEDQLLAVEKLLAEHSILPPPPPPEEEAPARPQDAPAVFPARTLETVACPRCRRRQRGDRNFCYACGLPFQYETE